MFQQLKLAFLSSFFSVSVSGRGCRLIKLMIKCPVTLWASVLKIEIQVSSALNRLMNWFKLPEHILLWHTFHCQYCFNLKRSIKSNRARYCVSSAEIKYRVHRGVWVLRNGKRHSVCLYVTGSSNKFCAPRAAQTFGKYLTLELRFRVRGARASRAF
jgi:hypothetical protein